MRKSSTLPLPLPLGPVLPARSAVPLPHLVLLAPHVCQFVRPLAGGALALQLLVEGVLLLQVVASMQSGTCRSAG